MLVTVNGSTHVKADREQVWAALHDVDVIASCIPGCCALTRKSERSFSLALHARIGPLALAYDGRIEIVRSDPPCGYSLVGHGDGGRAGQASGRIHIELQPLHRGCRIAYAAEADVQGPLTCAGRLVLTGVGGAIGRYFAVRFGEILGRHAPIVPAFHAA